MFFKGKNVKNCSKKNTPPNINTVSEIQTSDSDQSVNIDDDEMTLWTGKVQIW